MVVGVLAVSACAVRPLPDLAALPDAPPDFGRTLPDPAAATLLTVVEGELHVQVGRAGPMARLGHDHVISGPIKGRLHRSGERVQADLYVPVAALEVDPPAARDRLGWPPIDDADRQATRANLLSDAVLHAERYPFLRATVDALRDSMGGIAVDLTMAGGQVRRRVAVRVETLNQCRTRYSGDLVLQHAEFGLTPFSALGGALSVSEPIEVQFSLIVAPESGCPD